ncbi:flavin reductase family protein [Adhaeribacter soli]|uniref:2Fe-2S iron-sulfur cluster binding domain-containing protein n=1 Tax=Adhaeribacter soli TaxID=2607655 RepID=A0A5N1J4C7_9BACT|nr:iron-sulfur cluster-binding domain-containing protein [Adhaeribacter soli]KAA9345567.1 2Fe-2S iron-sulfur cluster binding domain-containing protein [Adhaeribacter soli]
MLQPDPDFYSLYHPLTITRIREEIPGFKTLFLEEANGEKIKYQAGQYLTLVTQEHNTEFRRSYSLISSPVLNEPLGIGVKRIPNGLFSRKLTDDAQVGDTLWTTGAGGFFTLPENLADYGQLFFLAAGSGITPVLSLIKTALFAFPDIPVVLIYSNSSHDRAAYRQEFMELEDRYPSRFKTEFLYSDAADLSRARLYKDLLQLFVKYHALTTPDKMLCYVCGPQNYMRMCTYGLNLAGIPLENIRKETFSTDKVLAKVQPPDTEEHTVSIFFNGQQHIIPAQYPATILQAAKKAGINLPYSCEAGKCGNCVARCKKGRVWMSYNEVLTEKEISKGLVLTCVGYPIGGDVVLEI